MNSKLKIIVGVLVVVLVGVGAAGSAVWWMDSKDPSPEKAEAKAEASRVAAKKEKAAKPVKYMTLEKVIVMLRRGPNEMGTHYLSADLVLTTDELGEKQTKEHLPMLRATAVQALSGHTFAEASNLTIEQFAEQLNKTFTDSYERDDREKPFGTVMIGKLIVE